MGLSWSVFQAVGLLGVSFVVGLFQQSLLLTLEREGPSESAQFPGLPETIWNWLPSGLTSFPAV